MIAIGAVNFFIVYIPRILTYILMRCKKTHYGYRRLHFIIRLITLLIQIVVNIAGIVALAAYSAKVYFVIIPYTLVPILGWAFTIGYIFVYDIYLTCVVRRYWNKSHHKGAHKVSGHSGNVSHINTTGPYMPQQYQTPGGMPVQYGQPG